MSFDWRLYIKLADELINLQRDKSLAESYWRSAISRAYYGVFCLSRNFLLSKRITIPRKNVHWFVIDRYKRSFDQNKKKIGIELDRLKKDRIDADYKDRISINKNYALRSYGRSERILQLLQNIGAV
ncbi:HEPN domain-containing protein [Candidatus Aerophobetes bacterium]|nr:HEPN domain-containing protein [Candidatus Aerophobetes bacterium]